MNKLKLSKILDIAAMIAIVAVFALYIFKKTDPVMLSFSLVGVAIIKMLASMSKSSYYNNLYNETKQERDLYKEKADYLENEINQLKNK